MKPSTIRMRAARWNDMNSRVLTTITFSCNEIRLAGCREGARMAGLPDTADAKWPACSAADCAVAHVNPQVGESRVTESLDDTRASVEIPMCHLHRARIVAARPL